MAPPPPVRASRSGSHSARHRAASLAPGLLLLAALLVWPVLGEGVDDDWSYTRSAELLARTGHIVYTGWTSPMLGWQLFLADGFIHLFGFSFTVVRLSTLLVALLTAWLTYGCLARCGVGTWNAALGTCALVLSPVALPLSFTYMTDISGLFVVVLCLYSCLRALEAESPRGTLGWLLLAVLGGAIGGTSRQIAWLTVLVMVPSLLWLLRRRRRVLLAGVLLELAAFGFVGWAMLWFRHQPLTLAEPLLAGPMDRATLAMIRNQALRALLELCFLLLPLLLGFLPAVPWRQRRVQATLGVAAAAELAYGLLLWKHRKLWLVVQPTLGNIVSSYGVLNLGSAKGPQLRLIPFWLGVALSALAIFAAVAVVCVIFCRSRLGGSQPQPRGWQPVPVHAVRTLLAPFCVAYLVLLVPRAAAASLFDRYLLVLLFVSTLGLLLLYECRVAASPSGLAIACTIFYASVTVAWTHDRFAQSRAELTAIHEVEASGVPANQISGGFAFNGWEELEQAGFVADRRPPGEPMTPAESRDACLPTMSFLTPRLHRHFALATEPAACAGPTTFAPVPYTAWLPPGVHQVYVVKDKPSQ